MDEEKNKERRESDDEEAKKTRTFPKPADGSRLHPRWADLYIRGTEEQLLTLLGNSAQMKRLVSVQGWEYVGDQEKKPGRIRIRFIWV